MEKPSTSTFLDLGTIGLPKETVGLQVQQGAKEGFSLFDTLLSEMSTQSSLSVESPVELKATTLTMGNSPILTTLTPPVNSFSLFDSITATLSPQTVLSEAVGNEISTVKTIIDVPSSTPIEVQDTNIGNIVVTIQNTPSEVLVEGTQNSVAIQSDKSVIGDDSLAKLSQVNIIKPAGIVVEESSKSEVLASVIETSNDTQRLDLQEEAIKNSVFIPENSQGLQSEEKAVKVGVSIAQNSEDLQSNESLEQALSHTVFKQQESKSLAIDDGLEQNVESVQIIDQNLKTTPLNQGLFDELVANIKAESVSLLDVQSSQEIIQESKENITQVLEIEHIESTKDLTSEEANIFDTKINQIPIVKLDVSNIALINTTHATTDTMNDNLNIPVAVNIETKSNTSEQFSFVGVGSLIDEIMTEATNLQINNRQDSTKPLPVLDNSFVKVPLEQALTEDLFGNMYMGSQKASTHLASLAQMHDAKQLFSNSESTVGTLKKGGNILGLGVKSIEDITPILANSVEKPIILNEAKSLEQIVSARVMFFQEEIQDKLALGEDEIKKVNQGFNDNVVVIKVQDTLNSNSLESKIIGARQHINSMMSDVARSMYEQYKPPLTAFKINLNPSQLGGIAIILKSDKSGLDISMSMSKQTTLETFIDTQSLLKTQIVKNFGENTNVNLNFSMQQDTQSSQEQANHQGGQQNSNNNSKQVASVSDIEISTNEELEKNQSYM